ncbi:Tyrosine recombinase XerC 2 [Clarias magur]|uniref:Tyrosine recombinase XerC 2 n=1 Tax=Clarias magur TaxID=1594786 RepID=A0A8J4UVB4_CLAMG|nr:Tyrosine recombinase XerC 2 [Clarias magur]
MKEQQRSGSGAKNRCLPGCGEEEAWFETYFKEIRAGWLARGVAVRNRFSS